MKTFHERSTQDTAVATKRMTAFERQVAKDWRRFKEKYFACTEYPAVRQALKKIWSAEEKEVAGAGERTAAPSARPHEEGGLRAVSNSVYTRPLGELLDQRATAIRRGPSPRAIRKPADLGGYPSHQDWLPPEMPRPQGLADFIERNRWQRSALSRHARRH